MPSLRLLAAALHLLVPAAAHAAAQVQTPHPVSAPAMSAAAMSERTKPAPAVNAIDSRAAELMRPRHTLVVSLHSRGDALARQHAGRARFIGPDS